MSIENFHGVITTGKVAGASLLRFKRSTMSCTFERNMKAILKAMNKAAEKYHTGQPGLDAEEIAADCVARKGAYADAVALEEEEEGGFSDEELFFLLPECLNTGEQLITNGMGDFQGDKYNARASNNLKLKSLFIPVLEKLQKAGTEFQSWSFYMMWEFTYGVPSGKAVGKKTGFTPKKKDAEQELADQMNALMAGTP